MHLIGTLTYIQSLSFLITYIILLMIVVLFGFDSTYRRIAWRKRIYDFDIFSSSSHFESCIIDHQSHWFREDLAKISFSLPLSLYSRSRSWCRGLCIIFVYFWCFYWTFLSKTHHSSRLNFFISSLACKVWSKMRSLSCQ